MIQKPLEYDPSVIKDVAKFWISWEEDMNLVDLQFSTKSMITVLEDFFDF